MCVRGCRRLSVKWHIRCVKSAQEWVFLSPIIFLAPRTVLVGGPPAIEQGKPESSAESFFTVIYEPTRPPSYGGFTFMRGNMTRFFVGLLCFCFIAPVFAGVECDDDKCWRNLTVGTRVFKAYNRRSTTPSLQIKDSDGNVWYVNFLAGNLSNTLHANYNGDIYSATDAQYEIVDGRLVWAHPDIYLKSNGGQYIDTGIIPSDTLGLKFNYWRESGTSDHVLIGSQIEIGSQVPEYARFTLGQSSSPYWGWNTYKHTGLSTTERYAVTLNYKNDRMVTYNDTVYGSNLATHLDNPYSIYVFCTNNHGTAAVCSKIKVYSVVITDGSDIIMHLVPVPAGLKIGDFTVPSNGMFDIVSQTFYGNSGSGEFEYGAEF